MSRTRSQRSAVIRSMAYTLPRRRISNQESPYRDIPNIPEGWWERWGCDNRACFDSEGGEYAEDLLACAALRALELAELTPGDVGLILGSTSGLGVRDRDGWALSPRIAARVKRAIGARSAVTWDLEHECLSFLAGLEIAVNYLRQGRFQNALLCCAEHPTGSLDFTDPSATIFGDGVVCAVLTGDRDDGELLSSAYESISQLYPLATLQWRHPTAKPEAERRPEDLWAYFTLKEEAPGLMQQFVPVEVPAMVNRCLAKVGMTPADVDFFVFHQPSQVLVNLWAASLGVGPDRFMTTMQDYGSLLAAAMPITAHRAMEEGRIKPGSKVVIAGAALGWSFGAQLWRWGQTRFAAHRTDKTASFPRRR